MMDPRQNSCSVNARTKRTKKEILEDINMTGFALLDVSLYLDTHPSDQEALNYFSQILSQYKEAKAEYSRIYGPLNIDEGVCDHVPWNWIQEPMPWEGGC